MTINSNSISSMPSTLLSTSSPLTIPPAVNSSCNVGSEPSSAASSQQPPSSTTSTSPLNSRSGGGVNAIGGGYSNISTTTVTRTSSTGLVVTNSGITSPIMAEPVAGPSGLGPVQSVPLVSIFFLSES